MPDGMAHLFEKPTGQLELVASRNAIFPKPKKMPGSLTWTVDRSRQIYSRDVMI